MSSASLAFDFAFLARLHIGGERLAAFLDQAGDIVREGLDLDRADLWRFLGRSLTFSETGFLAGSVLGFFISVMSLPAPELARAASSCKARL